MSSLCVIVLCMSRLCVVIFVLCDVVCLCMCFMAWRVFVVCLSISFGCFVCDVLVCCLFVDVGVYVLFVARCVVGCFLFIGLSCVYVLLVLLCFRFWCFVMV